MTGCCIRSWRQRPTQTPKRTPLEQKYGDFYAACMDTQLADKKGVAPLQPTLDAINALSDKKQLAALLGDAGDTVWHQRTVQLRRGPGPEGLHPADRPSRPGRAGSSRSRLLPAAEPAAAEDPRRIRRPHDKHVPARRGHAGKGRQRSAEPSWRSKLRWRKAP